MNSTKYEVVLMVLAWVSVAVFAFGPTSLPVRFGIYAVLIVASLFTLCRSRRNRA